MNQKISKIQISDFYISETLKRFSDFSVENSAIDIPIWKETKSMNEFCKIFALDQDDEKHSITCQNFIWFNQTFAKKQIKKSNWTIILENALETSSIHRQENQALLDQFIELNSPNEILESVERIRCQKTKEIYLLKQLACSLRFTRPFQIKKICEIVPLSVHQIKKGFQKYQRSEFTRTYIENRGAYKKTQKKITAERLEWLKSKIVEQDRPFNIPEIRQEFIKEYPQITISRQTIIKSIRDSLGFQFKTIPFNQFQKNSKETKQYRFWFCHFFLQKLEKKN